MKDCEYIDPIGNSGCGKLPIRESAIPSDYIILDFEMADVFKLIKQTPNDTELGKLIREKYGR